MNAAVFAVPYERSENGLEMNFAVNYMGHYYLATLLRQELIRSSPARVVVVSSESHKHLLSPVGHAGDLSLNTVSPSNHNASYTQKTFKAVKYVFL